MKRTAKRTLCLILVMALTTLGFSSCTYSDRIMAQGNRTHESDSNLWIEHDRIGPVDDREIVCWGDSLTSGVGASEATVTLNGGTFDISDLGFPEILEKLTGLATYNFGLAGATSKQIAYMQGGIEDYPEDEDEDESDYEYDDEYKYGDEYEYEDEDEDAEEEDRTEEVDLKPAIENMKALGERHTGDIIVIEMGSNGGWDDYDDLIGQYWDMINHADTPSYIIIGDTDDPEVSIDPDQEPFEPGEGPGETDWEAALAEEFGEHFINMRVFLIEHGLEAVGLEATDQDRSDAERGWISMQLRSDITHLNSYGYCAQAIAVYEKGRALRYWF